MRKVSWSKNFKKSKKKSFFIKKNWFETGDYVLFSYDFTDIFVHGEIRALVGRSKEFWDNKKKERVWDKERDREKQKEIWRNKMIS